MRRLPVRTSRHGDASMSRLVHRFFRFKREVRSYPNLPADGSAWGRFYACPTQTDMKPQQIDASGGCALCRPASGRVLASFGFQRERYAVVPSQSPLFRDQVILFPKPRARGSNSAVHRTAFDLNDILLMHRLAVQGFPGLVRTSNRRPACFRTAKPWASASGHGPTDNQTEAHFHLHCAPADSMPLLKPVFAPWDVCQDRRNGTRIRRLDLTGFYALAFIGTGSREIAQTFTLVQDLLRGESVPFNAAVLPHPDRTGIPVPNPCTVLIPRNAATYGAAAENLNGLEWMTGIVQPESGCVEVFDTIRRDETFRRAALAEPQQMELERLLRKHLGMPPSGFAVYPRLVSGPPYRPDVRRNREPGLVHPLHRYWMRPSVQPEVPYETRWKEANVLVRIIRASICQSDRRVLSGTKRSTLDQKPYVLGHEAGGFVVDPGPWERELHAGQKVVVLPHLTCGNCDPCHLYQQNLCRHMTHLGFDLNGSMAELMGFPYQCILPVEARFPTDALTLVEPLACVLRALFRIQDRFTKISGNAEVPAFIVFGGGPIGCLAARAVKRFWPDMAVTVVEPNSIRRRLLERLRLADRLFDRFPESEKGAIGFVASSKLQASLDAAASIRAGGTVVVFSGINTDEPGVLDDGSGAQAARFETIHRQERLETWTNPSGKPFILIGSSGYNFDDAVRSIRELQRHFEHYRVIQNVLVRGLASREAVFKPPIGATRSFAVPAVAALLSPKGVEDPEYGEPIAEMLKVVVEP